MISRDLARKMDALVEEKLNLAIEMFDLPITAGEVEIRYDVKGKTGGYAGCRTRNGVRHYFLRFNVEAIENHWDYMVNAVIPHEVAHIVAYVKPALGAKHHNTRWSIIDRKLGGNGNRCHSMPLTKARKTVWYIYEVAGEKVKMSKIRHNRMVTGKTSYSVKLATGVHKITTDHWTGRKVAA